MKKKIMLAWNIRRLDDESFVPATQRIMLKIVGFQLAIWATLRPLIAVWVRCNNEDKKKYAKNVRFPSGKQLHNFFMKIYARLICTLRIDLKGTL